MCLRVLFLSRPPGRRLQKCPMWERQTLRMLGRQGRPRPPPEENRTAGRCVSRQAKTRDGHSCSRRYPSPGSGPPGTRGAQSPWAGLPKGMWVGRPAPQGPHSLHRAPGRPRSSVGSQPPQRTFQEGRARRTPMTALHHLRRPSAQPQNGSGERQQPSVRAGRPGAARGVLCPLPPLRFFRRGTASERLSAPAPQLVGHLSPALPGLHSSRDGDYRPPSTSRPLGTTWKPGWGDTGRKTACTEGRSPPPPPAGSRGWPSAALEPDCGLWPGSLLGG